jgi:hypothetical protein
MLSYLTTGVPRYLKVTQCDLMFPVNATTSWDQLVAVATDHIHSLYVAGRINPEQRDLAITDLRAMPVRRFEWLDGEAEGACVVLRLDALAVGGRRWRDALAAQEGACNPRALVSALGRAFDEIEAEGDGSTSNLTTDYAVQAMVHQLAYLVCVGAFDRDYANRMKTIRQRAAGGA